VDAGEGINIPLDGVFQAGTVPVDVEGNTAGTNSFIIQLKRLNAITLGLFIIDYNKQMIAGSK
jgi:hypothetical protein